MPSTSVEAVPTSVEVSSAPVYTAPVNSTYVIIPTGTGASSSIAATGIYSNSSVASTLSSAAATSAAGSATASGPAAASSSAAPSNAGTVVQAGSFGLAAAVAALFLA